MTEGRRGTVGSQREERTISYRSTPRVHQSTHLVYPCPERSSGARYSGVPQKAELVYRPRDETIP